MGGKLSSSTCLKRALYQISRVLGLRRKPQSARRRDTLVLLSWGMITSILVYCMPREAPRFKGNVNQPDNMLWEETSRDLQDFNWKGKTLGGKWKLSLGFMNIAMWETDLTHYMWLPGEGGWTLQRYRSQLVQHWWYSGERSCLPDPSSSKAVVPKLCYTLESPRDLLKLQLSGLNLKPITSESLGGEPGINVF